MGTITDLDDLEIKDPRIAKCVLCLCVTIQIYFGLAIAFQLIG